MNGLTLHFDPNSRQFEAILKWQDDHTVEIVYGGAKYGGKSFLGGSLIFHDALVYPDTHYFIARRELNDLRKYTLPTIHKIFQEWDIDLNRYAKYNGQDNFFQCYNSSRVYLIECKHNPADPLFERFGSMEMTRGWIEEGGEIEGLAKENLLLSIGRMNNGRYKLGRKLLITCNPKKNFLYTDFYKPWTLGKLPADKAFVQAFPDDNVHGDKEYIKALKASKDKVMQERLVRGNWEYDDDPSALIPYDNIAAVFTNDFVKPSGKKYITADVARYGSDKTIVRVWDGFVVLERQALRSSSITQTAELIKKKADVYQIPMMRVIADEDGIGGGVVDILKCKGFIAGSSPINAKPGENYRNLKSQCAFKLAEVVNSNMIYEKTRDEDAKKLLIEDLEQIKQDGIDKDSKRTVMSKDKVKAIIGRSPDDGDTYIMRMFFELTAPGMGIVKPGMTRTTGGRTNYSM